MICVSRQLSNGYRARNALYMTLTRSFIQSHLILSADRNASILPDIVQGLDRINSEGRIEVAPPDEPEKARIKRTLRLTATSKSFSEISEQVFDELGVVPLLRDPLFDALKRVIGEDLDVENIKETAEFLYLKMSRGGGVPRA